MPLESSFDMVFVSVDGLSHTVISPCQWTNKTGQICCHGLTAIYCTASAWTKRISTVDHMEILYPIISQQFRICMGLFQCYLLLVIKWRHSWFSLAMSQEMGSKKNEPVQIRFGTRSKKYLGMWCGHKVIMLQNAESHKCYMSSRSMKEVYQHIYMDYLLWRPYRLNCFCSKILRD